MYGSSSPAWSGCSSCLGLKGGASARGDADLGRSTWGWVSVGRVLRRRRRRRRRRRVLLACGAPGASVAALLRRLRRRRRRFGDDGGADDDSSGVGRRRLRRLVGLRLGLGGFEGGVGATGLGVVVVVGGGGVTAGSRARSLGGMHCGLKGHFALGTGARSAEVLDGLVVGVGFGVGFGVGAAPLSAGTALWACCGRASSTAGS